MKVEAKAVRVIKRVMGDKAGGVLMEYVVLGLLVVAAVAAAVIVFGKSLKGGLDTMSDIAGGDTAAARTTLANSRTDVNAEKITAETHRTTIAK